MTQPERDAKGKFLKGNSFALKGALAKIEKYKNLRYKERTSHTADKTFSKETKKYELKKEIISLIPLGSNPLWEDRTPVRAVIEKRASPPTKKTSNSKSLIPYKGENPPTPAIEVSAEIRQLDEKPVVNFSFTTDVPTKPSSHLWKDLSQKPIDIAVKRLLYILTTPNYKLGMYKNTD